MIDLREKMEFINAHQQDVSHHINHSFEESEQDPERTRKNYLIVRQESKSYHSKSR